MISYTIHFCWGPLGFIWRMSFSWLKRFAHLSFGDNIFRFLTVIYYKQNDGHSLPTAQWKKYGNYLGKYQVSILIINSKIYVSAGKNTKLTVFQFCVYIVAASSTENNIQHLYELCVQHPLIKTLSKLWLRIHCGATREIYFVHFMPFVPYPFW